MTPLAKPSQTTGAGSERADRRDMKSGLLTDDDLFALTGFHRGAEQARALQEFGLRPMLSRGRVSITWEAITQRMIGGRTEAPKDAPNWSALNG